MRTDLSVSDYRLGHYATLNLKCFHPKLPPDLQALSELVQGRALSIHMFKQALYSQKSVTDPEGKKSGEDLTFFSS